ncbi:MAG: sensor histidine kinase [Sulfurospirillaceae bacterium]|nr:sensor histidine kinase [Sulfurospirillaceae bacterium]MDD2827869.1 sensor histidine kinase [Sulfurospirillaceae bacterium]
MRIKKTSLKRKLIVWIIVPLSVFTLLLSLFLYFYLQNKVNDFFNKRLYAIAQSIEQSIGVKDEKLFVDFPSFSIDFLSSQDMGVVYYSVQDAKGNVLIGYQRLLKKTIPKTQNKIFFNTTYDDIPLKAVSYKTSIVSVGKQYPVFITVAESMEERNINIQDMLTILISILLFVALFIIIVTLVAVKKGLLPLNTLKKIIQQRDSRDLEPLEFDAPKELEDIVESINILLERSRDTIEYIEHFNADVSHQLRTPIAELKVKLELLYDKKNKDYIALNRLLDNMAHIMEQLLLYAKTNANTINFKRFKIVNLNKFCKNYSKKTALRVYQKGFDYVFQDLNEVIDINSDPILLESMLDNIINNALHYAVDDNKKPIGTITLSIQRHQHTIWLCVQDEGKGVDEHYINHIFDRYYRVDSKKQGSGLGLSIVKQIAALHQAKVIAMNNNGLKVAIIFEHQKDDHTL